MENEETQETQQTQQTQQTQGTQGTLETLEVIKAELEEEKKVKAAAEAALAERDARIAELRAEGETLRTEGVAISEARDQAVSKYLEAVRALNSTIPQDIIAGDTIEDIDTSLEKAQTIASAVRQSLEAEAKETRVPAGAPTRGEISLEGLSPREKIAAGIMSLRGTQ